MKRYLILPLALLFIVGLSGCLNEEGGFNENDGDLGEGSSSSGVDFTLFVKDTLEMDSQLEPRPVNDVVFEFNDLENPDAYNDVVDD